MGNLRFSNWDVKHISMFKSLLNFIQHHPNHVLLSKVFLRCLTQMFSICEFRKTLYLCKISSPFLHCFQIGKENIEKFSR